MLLIRPSSRAAFAAAVILAATLLNVAIQAYAGGRSAFQVYYPAIALIGFYAGAGSAAVGVLAAAVIAVSLWVLPSVGGWRATDVADLYRALLFLPTAAIVAAVAAHARRLVTTVRGSESELRTVRERLELALSAATESERAARAARNELQLTADAMAAGVCRCSRDRRYLWANRQYLRWLGVDGPIAGRPLAELLTPELLQFKRPYIERVLAGETVSFEQRMPSARDLPYWIHGSYTPTHDASGAVDGWVAVITDRSEWHAVDAALREGEERLRLALDGAQMGMWSADLQKGTLVGTPRYFELFGVEPASGPVDIHRWRSLAHPDDVERVAAAWRAAAAGESPYDVEYRIPQPGGGDRWLCSRGRLHVDPSGGPTRMLGITMDVTERRAAEAAQVEANRRKDEFLATLAHELRNPLAPIRYASRLFRADTPPDMIEDAGRMVERQLAHMARLLDDLLDVSRITRGALELRSEPVDLRALLESSVDAARALAERVGHRLELRLPPGALPVLGDAARLTQVFGNLLDNATKYTQQPGRITVAAALEGGEVVVSVGDTGAGIDAELLPHVFELFSQGGRRPRSSSGLGIGLSLARRLVEMHTGRIEARSEGPGRGSEFVVRLPAIAEAPAIAGRIAAADKVRALGAGDVRVLVVDDNVDAADALANVLKLAGYAPTVAYDGATALELAEIVRPAVVLLDLGLPRLSGLDVARRVRAQPWGAQARLIAVTGWGREDDRRRSEEAGFDEHLTKPVDPERLVGLVAGLARGAA